METPIDSVKAILDFLIDRTAAIPDDVRGRLRELVQPGLSPVVAIVEASELIYARRDELPPELLDIGAQMATVAATHNFHGMANENRGYAMAAAIRRMPAVADKPPPAKLEEPEPRRDLAAGTGQGERSQTPAPSAPAGT